MDGTSVHMMAHSAQGQTFKQGPIVDLRIGGGTSPLSSYVDLTRMRRRDDMLIFRHIVLNLGIAYADAYFFLAGPSGEG